jgi:hypothetical protein
MLKRTDEQVITEIEKQVSNIRKHRFIFITLGILMFALACYAPIMVIDWVNSIGDEHKQVIWIGFTLGCFMGYIFISLLKKATNLLLNAMFPNMFMREELLLLKYHQRLKQKAEE